MAEEVEDVQRKLVVLDIEAKFAIKDAAETLKRIEKILALLATQYKEKNARG